MTTFEDIPTRSAFVFPWNRTQLFRLTGQTGDGHVTFEPFMPSLGDGKYMAKAETPARLVETYTSAEEAPFAHYYNHLGNGVFAKLDNDDWFCFAEQKVVDAPPEGLFLRMRLEHCDYEFVDADEMETAQVKDCVGDFVRLGGEYGLVSHADVDGGMRIDRWVVPENTFVGRAVPQAGLALGRGGSLGINHTGIRWRLTEECLRPFHSQEANQPVELIPSFTY